MTHHLVDSEFCRNSIMRLIWTCVRLLDCPLRARIVGTSWTRGISSSLAHLVYHLISGNHPNPGRNGAYPFFT